MGRVLWILLGCAFLTGCELVYFVREEPPPARPIEAEEPPEPEKERARDREDDMLERGERVSSKPPRRSEDGEPEYRELRRTRSYEYYHRPSRYCSCRACYHHYHGWYEPWGYHHHSYWHYRRRGWSIYWGW